MERKRKKTKIKLESIQDDSIKEYEDLYRRADDIHSQRTRRHDFYTKVAHMENLYDDDKTIFSEGSTQAIQRKIRATTLQRIPDGELITQYDKNSLEQVEIDYIFKNKILQSEFAGKDMLKNLWRTFDNSYIYGFGCVRTGFEKDTDGDIRTTYSLIPYDMVLPNPDCKFIEEAEWYIVEEMISKAFIESLFDANDKLVDKTWNEDVLRYILQEGTADAADANKHQQLADKKHGITELESINIRTLYRKGDKEFVSYSPKLKAVLRTTKNYDPRLDVPLHFMILEPDPEFALGCSSVMWTLSQQQFADAFQSTAYDTLLLASRPPLIGSGNLTESDIFLEQDAFWDLGSNPNAKIEKFPVETTSITQYGSILEQVSATMARNLNAPDQTIASDAHVPGYSKTPQGVEQQSRDKTVTVNQYQKRVEIFFAEWANHALRSYLSAMNGKQDLTVTEETRRKIFSIEEAMQRKEERDNPENPKEIKSIIKENKITIDFSKLSSDLLEFSVKTGSLIQDPIQKQREAIQEMLVSVSQMIGNISDENKGTFESIILSMVQRLVEISDVDISASSAEMLNASKYNSILKAFAGQIISQQRAIGQLQQLAVNNMQTQAQQQNNIQGQPVQEPVVDTGAAAAQQQAPQQEASPQQGAELPPEVMQQLLAQQAQQQQAVPQSPSQPAEEESSEQVE